MSQRTACSVPFCRRTKGGRWAWWLCADHWRAVDRSLKQRRTRMRRRLVKRGEVTSTKNAYHYSPLADRVLTPIERRMVRQAIERATGVSA